MVNRSTPFPIIECSIESARQYPRQMKALWAFMAIFFLGWHVGHVLLNWSPIPTFTFPLMAFSVLAYLIYRGILSIIDYAATTFLIGAGEIGGYLLDLKKVEPSIYTEADSAHTPSPPQTDVAKLFDLAAFRKNPITDKDDSE